MVHAVFLDHEEWVALLLPCVSRVNPYNFLIVVIVVLIRILSHCYPHLLLSLLKLIDTSESHCFLQLPLSHSRWCHELAASPHSPASLRTHHRRFLARAARDQLNWASSAQSHLSGIGSTSIGGSDLPSGCASQTRGIGIGVEIGVCEEESLVRRMWIERRHNSSGWMAQVDIVFSFPVI